MVLRAERACGAEWLGLLYTPSMRIRNEGILAAALLLGSGCPAKDETERSMQQQVETPKEAARTAGRSAETRPTEAMPKPEEAKPVAAAQAAAPAPQRAADDPLLHPEKATATAPDSYQVRFETTKGAFTVVVHRDWAPRGADRFYNLVKLGFYDGVAFFRVLEGFVVQFGIHGEPKVASAWREARIQDDPVKQSNTRGRITFATAGPDTRTTQVFVNLGDNKMLDNMGFAPFGEVDAEGMKVIEALYAGYGEGAPRGRGPDQGRMQREGNAYLRQHFPQLDYVKTARIVEQASAN